MTMVNLNEQQGASPADKAAPKPTPEQLARVWQAVVWTAPDVAIRPDYVCGEASERKVAALAESMRQGWDGPPLPEGVTGSHRIEAAAEADLPEVPVIQLDEGIDVLFGEGCWDDLSGRDDKG